MIKAVSGLFSPAPRIKEKSYDAILAAYQILQKKSEEPAHYRWVKKVAEAYQLDQSHPLNRLFKSVRSKGAPFASEKLVEKARGEISQGMHPPEALIAYLQTYGASITSIEVSEASDDLFECLSSYCPNLSTFVFDASHSPCMDLTDKGLESLAKLSQLSVLEFSAFHLFNVSENGIETLFNSAHFSSNLVSLTISSSLFNDACYCALSKYRRLESLFIKTDTLYYKTLSSYALCPCLQRFSLSISDKTKDFATDDFLNILPQNLVFLALKGSFKSVSASGFSNAMKRLIKLEHLSIAGTPTEPSIVKGLRPTLISLHIEDASLLSAENLKDLFKAETDLQELSLRNVMLTEITFPNTLKKLHLHAPKLEDLSGLPEKLNEITLEGIEVSSSEFEGYFLRAFEIEELNVVNCSFFNRESLEAALKTLGDKITKITLIGTSIDDIGVVELGDFSRLTTIILADLKAVTKMGITRFLGDDRVAARTRNLYFYGLFLSSAMTPLFTPFENLRVLYIGNSSAGVHEAERIFENETLVKNRTRSIDWSGPALYANFLSEIK